MLIRPSCPLPGRQLGVGSIGTLLAHQLRRTLRPASQFPITLHVRKSGLPTALRGAPAPRDSTLGRRGADAGRVQSLQPDVQLLVRDTAGTITPAAGFDLVLSPSPHAGPPIRANIPARFPSSTADAGGTDPIDALLVTLKCPATLPALAALKHRLRPESVVALVQNGMGVYDELCERVWPDPDERPQFILGTTTHGATLDRRGWVYTPGGDGGGAGGAGTKAGPAAVADSGLLRKTVHLHGTHGELKLAVVPDPRGRVDYTARLFPAYAADPSSFRLPPAPPPLPLPSLAAHGHMLEHPHPVDAPAPTPLEITLATLLSVAPLAPALLPIAHMHHELLLKLAVNAIVNPLTAVLGVPNGQLAAGAHAHTLVKAVADECSAVLLAYLASLHGGNSSPRADLATRSMASAAAGDGSGLPPDILHRFRPRELERLALNVAARTSKNTSSMLSDVQRGQQTEIEYINGYIIELGQRVGVPTPVNAMLIGMVKAKQAALAKSRW